MIKLYHAPLSRSVRVLWLLEELGLPYELHAAPLEPPAPKPFAQKTPSGKVPTIEDDGVTIFESGAIVEYILEKYGNKGLAPAVGSPLRGSFLQWVHFADATAFTGLGNIAWHTRFKEDAESVTDALADYRGWAEAALDALERNLRGKDFLLGAEFSAADVMVGYTVLVAKALGLVGERHPGVDAYLARLTERPALRRALQA
ncbi:MAG TPA: glutathione S-transferase family protein [Myxococcota bacterium]|nr:glutathione S-transferase family protein [Myxococcota bacterium]